MSSSRRVRKTENTSRRTQPETETRQHYPGQPVLNVQQEHSLPGVPPPVPPHRGGPLRKGSIVEGVFAYQIQEVEPSDKNMVLARNHGLQQRPESPQHCDNLDSENDRRNPPNEMKDRESYMYNRGAELREMMDRVKKPFQAHEEAIGSRSHRGQKRSVQDPESRSRDLWRDKLNDLEAKLRSYDMQNKKLSEELQLERAGVERIKRAANQMQSNMDNREMFLGEQLNDDTVKPDFDKLMSDVRTWSVRFSGGEGHACNPADFGEYQRIAPMCASFGELEEFFKNKRHAKMFVRGWTAYVMCTRLFRNLDATPAGTVGEDAWLGRALADNFGCLEHELWFTDRQVITYKSFNDWRAYTAELLGKVASIRTEKPAENKQKMIAAAISEVMQVVKVWLKSEAAEDVQVAEEGLRLIFNDAVEFAQTLRRQRVLWSIRFPSVPGGAEFGPLKFDPVLMEDLNEEDEVDIEALKKCGVDLVVTPVLYKRGTMNGEFFDSEKAISQAKVVVAIKR